MKAKKIVITIERLGLTDEQAADKARGAALRHPQGPTLDQRASAATPLDGITRHTHLTDKPTGNTTVRRFYVTQGTTDLSKGFEHLAEARAEMRRLAEGTPGRYEVVGRLVRPHHEALVVAESEVVSETQRFEVTIVDRPVKEGVRCVSS